MEYVIGLDLGTGTIKGIAVDSNGEILAKHSEVYKLYTEGNGYSEQNPEDWYEASLKASFSSGVTLTDGLITSVFDLDDMFPTFTFLISKPLFTR